MIQRRFWSWLPSGAALHTAFEVASCMGADQGFDNEADIQRWHQVSLAAASANREARPNHVGEPDTLLVWATIHRLVSQAKEVPEPNNPKAEANILAIETAFHEVSKALETKLKRRLLRLGYPSNNADDWVQEVLASLARRYQTATDARSAATRLDPIAFGYLNHRLIDDWRKTNKPIELKLDPQKLAQVLELNASEAQATLRTAREQWDWINWLMTLPNGLTQRQVKMLQTVIALELPPPTSPDEAQKRFVALGFTDQTAFNKEFHRVRQRLKALRQDESLAVQVPPQAEALRKL